VRGRLHSASKAVAGLSSWLGANSPVSSSKQLDPAAGEAAAEQGSPAEPGRPRPAASLLLPASFAPVFAAVKRRSWRRSRAARAGEFSESVGVVAAYHHLFLAHAACPVMAYFELG